MLSEKCRCQDSNGHICGKVMTTEENRQDGMCGLCASHVWNELTSDTVYHWEHVR